MARRKKESDAQIIKDVDQYLYETRANEEIPQLIRFARRHGLTKQGLYYRANQNPELLASIKAIIDEKELVLEEGGLTGKFQPSMTIFSLKQLGWKDKVDVDEGDDEDDGTGVVMIAPLVERDEKGNGKE